MKYRKIIVILSIVIILLSGVAALIGIFSGENQNYKDVVTSFGQTITLYNKGVYARDSISMASQAIAQDCVTMLVGIPLLISSLYLVHKRSVIGLSLLTGTIAYFLYTYTSYSFLVWYNPLYLVYVAIMTLSFYTFVLCMKEMLQREVCNLISKQFPVTLLQRFLVGTGLVLGGMWLGRILPTIGRNIAPVGLEQYSTLGIQTLDLGVIVPACFVAAYLLWKKNDWGYVLAIVLVCKAITMTAAVSAMAFLMKANGVEKSILELVVFPIIFSGCVLCMSSIISRMKGRKFDAV